MHELNDLTALRREDLPQIPSVPPLYRPMPQIATGQPSKVSRQFRIGIMECIFLLGWKVCNHLGN
jgi:hypothetical protein